ncbi:hypothetical protein Pmani_034486 [Petrolisthes manimaculis]|uniref:Uncharacterized protein n=1 Tax=Petrolisthes manimaculis TaxID=1843537 RepID=A0AAE1TP33_9EUCA|nr:hypothetical protein Pmani_034486 [Petrolisthes manimaculis]
MSLEIGENTSPPSTPGCTHWPNMAATGHVTENSDVTPSAVPANQGSRFTSRDQRPVLDQSQSGDADLYAPIPLNPPINPPTPPLFHWPPPPP